jgi:hypothetical protein
LGHHDGEATPARRSFEPSGEYLTEESGEEIPPMAATGNARSNTRAIRFMAAFGIRPPLAILHDVHQANGEPSRNKPQRGRLN